MPPASNRVVELREREVGGLPPKSFANAVMASEGFVRSLALQKRLRKHKASVHTISFNADGSLLLSGSEDRTVVVWDWEEGVPAFSFHTAHGTVVMQAEFMPFSGDRSIVSRASDGEVRHLQIHEGGSVTRRILLGLEVPVTVCQLAIEQGTPHTFYGCCKDGSVRLFDLRGKDSMELFKCRAVDHGEAIKLYNIAIDPSNPCCLAVGTSDQFVRIYDARKIYQDGNSSFARPIEHFCPPHLIGGHKDGLSRLAYSQTGELLASYLEDNIYLFTREHGLHFNNIEVDKQLVMDETEGACLINVPPSTFSRDKLPIPKTFKGDEDKGSLQGASFLGPNCDYVTSGTAAEHDYGYIFIWRKRDGELIRVMRGDFQAVYQVEQHPSGIAVASCGIDGNIKIWGPEGEGPSIDRVYRDEEEMHWPSASDSDYSFNEEDEDASPGY